MLEWLVAISDKLMLSEYFVLLFTFTAINIWGITDGFLAGILLSVVVFAYTYSVAMATPKTLGQTKVVLSLSLSLSLLLVQGLGLGLGLGSGLGLGLRLRLGLGLGLRLGLRLGFRDKDGIRDYVRVGTANMFIDGMSCRLHYGMLLMWLLHGLPMSCFVSYLVL